MSTARGAGVVLAPSCNLGLCPHHVPPLSTFVFTFGVFRLRHNLSRFICANLDGGVGSCSRSTVNSTVWTLAAAVDELPTLLFLHFLFVSFKSTLMFSPGSVYP